MGRTSRALQAAWTFVKMAMPISAKAALSKLGSIGRTAFCAGFRRAAFRMGTLWPTFARGVGCVHSTVIGKRVGGGVAARPFATTTTAAAWPFFAGCGRAAGARRSLGCAVRIDFGLAATALRGGPLARRGGRRNVGRLALLARLLRRAEQRPHEPRQKSFRLGGGGLRNGGWRGGARCNWLCGRRRKQRHFRFGCALRFERGHRSRHRRRHRFDRRFRQRTDRLVVDGRVGGSLFGV